MRMPRHRTLCAFVAATILSTGAPTLLQADIKFTRLSANQFIVHHRKHTLVGAEAMATKTVFAEAASICVAAQYTHFEVQDLNIGERKKGPLLGGRRGASADVRVKFYRDPSEETVSEKDLIACAPLSDPAKVPLARRKLAIP